MGHEALTAQKSIARYEPMSILHRPKVIHGSHCSQKTIPQAEASSFMLLTDVL